MKIGRLVTRLALLTSLLVGSYAQVYAQTSSPGSASAKGITVSPSTQEVILGPGLLQARTAITVRNQTGRDVFATINLVDFEGSDEFGGVAFGKVGAAPSTYSLANWMQLPNGPTVTIASDQSVTIPLIIQNTSDLAPGGHYGAAIVSLNSITDTGKAELNFKQEVASLIFVKKTGGERYGLELTAIKTNRLPAIPQEVNLTFKSTGNVHVVPRGLVEVTDPAGKLVAKGIINPASTLVLPDKTRQFVTILQPVNNSDKKGRYKITAYYRYDGQEDFSSKSIFFTRPIASGRLIAAMITGAGVLCLGLFFWIRRRKHLHKNRSKKPHDIAL